MVEQQQPRATLSKSRSATLESVAEALYPADELGPGATALGLARYVERLLQAGSPWWLAEYEHGLDSIERIAQSRYAQPFPELAPERQNAILASIENGLDDPVESPALREFFDLVLEHVFEGLFADPVYLDGAENGGWRLVGYEGPRLEVSAADQQIDADWAPHRRSIYLEPVFRKEAAR